MHKTILIIFVATISCAAASFPPPLLDPPEQGPTGIAVLAGGCFWGVEAVFDHVAGVKQAISGYAGGARETARYERVETGRTGHAESVKVIYDPSRISYGKLLEIFFSVAHDPTQLNRQGPDEGPQYRSAIFYLNDEQKRVAEAYIRQLNESRVFKHKIVTEVAPLPNGFFPAEAYHQHYLEHNPANPYIVFNDLPKLRRLKRDFPELWTEK
jgi:peptide-methionine (S)-S-oxide reductase